MASPDPFNSSQTFTDLLQSQQEINTEESFSQPQSPPNENQATDQREPRQRWKLPEEKVLVSAWLNTSKDVVVGNEQKGGTFWKRVAAYYAASPDGAKGPPRTSNTYKQKWGKINESVSKFVGCYASAERQKRSGEGENEVLQLAYKLYFQDHKVKFVLEHAWRLLKNDQKWCTLIVSRTSQSSKRAKLNDTAGYACSSTEAGAMERPMGVKAAKAKERNKGKAKAVESEESLVKLLEELWVIKEKDLVMKERISKNTLLESLIKKNEPLTEIELCLYEKLIHSMI